MSVKIFNTDLTEHGFSFLYLKRSGKDKNNISGKKKIIKKVAYMEQSFNAKAWG